MVSKDDIRMLISRARPIWKEADERDVVFCALLSIFDDSRMLYRIVYGSAPNGNFEAFVNSQGVFLLKNEMARLMRGIKGDDAASNILGNVIHKDIIETQIDNVKQEESDSDIDDSDKIDKGLVDSLSREENRKGMIKLLKTLPRLVKEKKLTEREAVKIEGDIRVQLEAKFDLEESMEEQRVIVVPQKHDLICPHTNRECTSMPSKEACMEYYGLKEKGNDNADY